MENAWRITQKKRKQAGVFYRVTNNKARPSAFWPDKARAANFFERLKKHS